MILKAIEKTYRKHNVYMHPNVNRELTWFEKQDFFHKKIFKPIHYIRLHVLEYFAKRLFIERVFENISINTLNAEEIHKAYLEYYDTTYDFIGFWSVNFRN